jgi:hypothetical protein
MTTLGQEQERPNLKIPLILGSLGLTLAMIWAYAQSGVGTTTFDNNASSNNTQEPQATPRNCMNVWAMLSYATDYGNGLPPQQVVSDWVASRSVNELPLIKKEAEDAANGKCGNVRAGESLVQILYNAIP